MIGRWATPEGSRRRAEGGAGYRVLGATGLSVSIVGFGGYRTGRTNPTHRAALEAALAAGVNLIDTSSNYQLGDSERLVGEVLAEGAFPRDEVVVVSKIGYVQGPNLQLAREREAAGRPFPDMVKYADGVWHCISPDFLDDQLGRALDRLGLEAIDVLLLHNPEYFLSDAAHRPDDHPLDETRAAFYDRLRRAFEYLDRAVRDGRIRAYGVSSNTCVSAADDPEATSVTRMQEASGGRMEVLQLPYNLFETGALLERNTPEGTALDAARARGLGVLVNRPLNAIPPGGRGLIRLADPLPAGDPRAADLIRAAIEPHLPLELRGESLSRLALDFVASTPGVTCVLNGMRNPAYVADAVGMMTLLPIPDVTAVARAFRQQLTA